MGSSKEFYFQYPFVWYALIVGTLAIGYLLMNIFLTGPNLSGDVCSILFGSTSILTETPVGSTIVAIDMIAFATASIFGKVIAM